MDPHPGHQAIGSPVTNTVLESLVINASAVELASGRREIHQTVFFSLLMGVFLKGLVVE